MEPALDRGQHKTLKPYQDCRTGVLIAIVLAVIVFLRLYLWTTLFRSGSRRGALSPCCRGLSFAKQYGWDGNEYWASAKISAEEFAQLAVALKATKDPEKLNYWAGKGFISQSSPDISAWWCKNTDLNQDTFIAVGSHNYILLKYENGRFFLNHSSF